MEISEVQISEVRAINARASVLMKRGIALLEDASANAETEALAHFDRAYALRRDLPIESDHWLRYGLAACCLNRADALARLGDITAAIASYDEGIAVLKGLPFHEDPRYPRRLVMAHQNRGLALQSQGRAEAITAFRNAIAVLEYEDALNIPDRQYLLGVVLMNFANAGASLTVREVPDSAFIARAALRAIFHLAELEESDAAAADAGLRARYIICRALAPRLSRAIELKEPLPDEAHTATDTVDEALALIRHWERQGISRFRLIAGDLLRFGALIFSAYQPQFLEEFVRDNIDPAKSSPSYVSSVEILSASREALASRPRELRWVLSISDKHADIVSQA